MLAFLSLKTILLVLHVFGAVIGAGGAFVSDGMFMTSIRDGRMSRTELRFLLLGSRYVWAGLFLLILSGIGMFALAPAAYLASGKFLAKMTIVAVLTINGILFHRLHIPVLRGALDEPLQSSAVFMRRAPFIFISGAVSMVSWASALVLGMLKGVPYGYATILSVYAVALLVAICAALGMKHMMFPAGKTSPGKPTESKTDSGQYRLN
jgi:hypothetical protein